MQPAGHENQFTGFHDCLGVELDWRTRQFVAIGRTPGGKSSANAAHEQVARKRREEPETTYCQSEGMLETLCQRQFCPELEPPAGVLRIEEVSDAA
jgi:hypothetical protein